MWSEKPWKTDCPRFPSFYPCPRLRVSASLYISNQCHPGKKHEADVC